MLHGFRGTHHGLQLIADELKEFEVIVPDLPGFSEGEQLENYTLDAYVEWVHSFIEKQKFKTPPILLGHSFGSIVSSAYAAKYPKTISKLILLNPVGAPALEGPRIIMSKLAVFYYWVGTKLPSNVAHKWLTAQFVTFMITVTMSKTKDKKLRAFIHNEHRRYFSSFHSAASVAQGFNVSISHSVRDFAPSIKTTTLLIAADKDDVTSLTQQKELHKLFPHATLKVIENVGHLTHYETPDQVARYIIDFIKPR